MTKILPILSWVFVLFSAACSGGHSDGQSPDTTAPAERVAEAPGVEAPLTYFQRQGQRLFLHYCAVCHGDRGAGDGFNAWNLDPRPRDLGDSAYQRAVGRPSPGCWREFLRNLLRVFFFFDFLHFVCNIS